MAPVLIVLIVWGVIFVGAYVFRNVEPPQTIRVYAV